MGVCSMPGAGLTSCPRGVFAATAALSMSPVARWHRQCSSFIFGDCVPFPQPGGPAEHAQNAHDRPLHKVSKRGSEKAADKALAQRQLCQITYEYHMLLWSCRTFDPSMDLLDEVVCGNIFQVGGRHWPRRHSPEGAPLAATKQCRKPHRLQDWPFKCPDHMPSCPTHGHTCMHGP